MSFRVDDKKDKDNEAAEADDRNKEQLVFLKQIRLCDTGEVEVYLGPSGSRFLWDPKGLRQWSQVPTLLHEQEANRNSQMQIEP